MPPHFPGLRGTIARRQLDLPTGQKVVDAAQRSSKWSQNVPCSRWPLIAMSAICDEPGEGEIYRRARPPSTVLGTALSASKGRRRATQTLLASEAELQHQCSTV
jgi:hypothetical protein